MNIILGENEQIHGGHFLAKRSKKSQLKGWP
jgi:hypothetical protein